MKSLINLKLPLIGINRIKFEYHSNNYEEKEQNICREPFCIYFKGKEENKKIEEMEIQLGNYIKFTGEYKKILSFLFPEAVDENFEINAHLFSCPLAIKEEDKYGNNVDDEYSSAWANLMYELGEFGIDEIHDPDDPDLIKKKIPHIYKKGDTWYTWWANIPDAEEIVQEIWQRITGEDVSIIFVDDDPEFSKHFLGESNENKKNPDLLCININSDLGKINRSLIWFDTGPFCNEKKIKEQIKKIIDINKKKSLVFVIDLLFKKKVSNTEINCIKGDTIIDFIREKKEDSLIIGFTAGTSPFIINSAEKAGADIVVFKKRGDDPESIVDHTPGGNPVGVFDLLWAISWNVSVWRLLEDHKNRYLKDEKGKIENIPMKIFKKINNASPFWKVYLEKWKTQINEEKIKRLLGK